MESGCDVIGADLPYVHSICIPLATFEPRSPESIAKAVLQYKDQPCPTKQLVHDMVDDVIDTLLGREMKV